MTIKVVPMSLYDFEHYSNHAANVYGVCISTVRNFVDISDPENPRCFNCEKLICGAYENPNYHPNFCSNCGAGLVWPDEYEKYQVCRSK